MNKNFKSDLNEISGIEKSLKLYYNNLNNMLFDDVRIDLINSIKTEQRRYKELTGDYFKDCDFIKKYGDWFFKEDKE